METSLEKRDLGAEEGYIPFFLIEDDYGIAADEYCYMLCQRKKMNRTVKDENGNPAYVESYLYWRALKYSGTFQNAIECYVEIKERQLNARHVKNKDYQKVIDVYNEIREIVANAFSATGINQEFLSFGDLLSQKNKLLNEIDELSDIKYKVETAADDLLQIIKDKRKIIIGETEGKKHKMKLEE